MASHSNRTGERDRLGEPRRRLYASAIRRVRPLRPEDAATWLAGHGLLGVAEDPRTPPRLIEALEPVLEQTRASNIYRIWRFQEIVDALDGIPLCPLKGIHLLNTVYVHRPDLRPMEDIDLLIPERLVEPALERLRHRLGLRETRLSRELARVTHQRALSDGALKVELHVRLADRHVARSSWADLAPAPAQVHDRRVWAIDAETTLVHLIAHFVGHGPYLRLKWVDDIVRLAELEPDAARVGQRARDLGAWRTLVAGIRILRRALSHELLPGLPDSADPVGQRLIAANERVVWRSGGEIDPARGLPTSRLRRNATALLLTDGVGPRVRFAATKGAELAIRALSRLRDHVPLSPWERRQE